MTAPWEIPTEPEQSISVIDLYNACSFAMEHVRIRVTHAGQFRLFAMRADDPNNPCGEIVLNDGSRIRVEVFGVPGPTEKVSTAQEIITQIMRYIRTTGLTVPV